MAWYIRGTSDERLDEIYPRVIACFEAAALATGCTFEVSQSGHRYSAMSNNELMVELYQTNSRDLGRDINRLADLPRETSGSTDMGNVSQVVPSIHPMLDLNCYPTVNHQPEFAAHTTTDDGKAAIRDGALAMAWTIIDLAEGNRWSEL
jgi:metal-dependent amidase/aminoacylase/carboxypeptidase family protein